MCQEELEKECYYEAPNDATYMLLLISLGKPAMLTHWMAVAAPHKRG